MALTYLNLVNATANHLGETELDNSNFANSYGTHNMMKRAVNYAIQDINRMEYTWPFQYVQSTITSVKDQAIYDPPADVKIIDWDTFYLTYNQSESIYPQPLTYISHEEWHARYRANDRYEAEEQDDDVERYPYRVFPNPDNKIGLSPIPNSTNHAIKFHYFKNEPVLSSYNDETNIPEQYENVIVMGALYYVYKFRDNAELAQETLQSFRRGVHEMRGLLINRFNHVRDTRTFNRNYGFYYGSHG